MNAARDIFTSSIVYISFIKEVLNLSRKQWLLYIVNHRILSQFC